MDLSNAPTFTGRSALQDRLKRHRQNNDLNNMNNESTNNQSPSETTVPSIAVGY